MPQIGKQLESVDIRDAKIAELTADAGASPTYGTPIDIPNVVTLSWVPQVNSQQVRGDSRIKGVFSQVESYEVTLEFNSVPLDAVAVMIGGAVTQTPESIAEAKDSKSSYTIGPADAAGKYFKVEGLAREAAEVGGSAGNSRKVAFYKLKAKSVSNMGLNGDVARMTVVCDAIATSSSDAFMEDVLMENKITSIS